MALCQIRSKILVEMRLFASVALGLCGWASNLQIAFAAHPTIAPFMDDGSNDPKAITFLISQSIGPVVILQGWPTP